MTNGTNGIDTLRDMYLDVPDIHRAIDFTNDIELSCDFVVASPAILEFISDYKEFWEYITALYICGSNLPMGPRMKLSAVAESLAIELGNGFSDEVLRKELRKLGFEFKEDSADKQVEQ